jgi:hypothetical protein
MYSCFKTWIVMYFFNLLLLFFFATQSSNLPTVDRDMSNPYGGISYPAHIKSKIRICFNKPQFWTSYDTRIIEIDTNDSKFITELNALNKIIYSSISNVPNNHLIYLDIPSITDIHPLKCSIFENRHAIELLEKIKNLNTTNEFEIEDKLIIDPFRLTENFNAYKEVHSENIFIKSYRYSLALSAIVTLLFVALPTKDISPMMPVLAFLTPFLFNYKYVKYWIETFPSREALDLSGSKKTIAVSSVLLLLPAFGLYLVNLGLHKIKTLF